MSLHRLFASKLILNTVQRSYLSTPIGDKWQHVTANFLQRQLPLTNTIRQTSFFNKLPADELWKGVSSVSNAGKKRGRGKKAGKKMIRDLNRGQVIGVGRTNMVWPGLNAPIVRGKELVQQQKLPPDEEREAKLKKLRDAMGNFRFMKLSPLDRGWSGSKMPGRSVGPPDAIGEDTFENFDTRILELKTVFIMKGNLGRKRRLAVMAVTGNGNGLVGFANSKATETKVAVRKAKNRAGQKLMHIELCNGHTVFHDFSCQFGKTKIFVYKRPEGHGLVCHRAIKTICEVLGIKDLYAKMEGSRCLQHVVKAFFLGLLQQKTHQQIAEEKGLHLVEFRKEYGNVPKIVASPSVCRKKEEIQPNEIMDFTQYCLNGKIMLKRKTFPPFYQESYGYKLHLSKMEKVRGQKQVRRDMLTHYGEMRSFLTEKHPECRPPKHTPSQEDVD